MSVRTKLQIGDVFEMPLPNGELAYAQYVHQNGELGYLMRVFDLVTSEPLTSIEILKGRGLLFPPVFVGLRATARSGRWKHIGNFPVGEFEFPKFRFTMGTKPGTYHDWRIWDGSQAIKIGSLPEQYRSLELKSVWGDQGLEERIVAGTYRGDKMF